jgi:hypothetical protein
MNWPENKTKQIQELLGITSQGQSLGVFVNKHFTLDFKQPYK